MSSFELIEKLSILKLHLQLNEIALVAGHLKKTYGYRIQLPYHIKHNLDHQSRTKWASTLFSQIN